MNFLIALRLFSHATAWVAFLATLTLTVTLTIYAGLATLLAAYASVPDSSLVV